MARGKSAPSPPPPPDAYAVENAATGVALPPFVSFKSAKNAAFDIARNYQVPANIYEIRGQHWTLEAVVKP